MNASTKTVIQNDYEVADLSLAGWGRREIAIAETEMPGLASLRDKYAGQQPRYRIDYDHRRNLAATDHKVTQ